MIMGSDRTGITDKNLNKLRTEIWTTEDILDFLNHGAVYRSFSDVLSKFCFDADLEKKLAENMSAITGKSNALMSKNVKNWLYHNMTPQRKQLFQICFALNLDEKQADQLITSASETGIHYRNPEEIIYAYGLRKRRSWKETEVLCGKLIPMCQQDRKHSEDDEETFSRAYKVSTSVIKDNFFRFVNSDEELEDFLMEYMPVLGRFHRAAYRDFMRMLDILRLPEQKARKYSIEKIVDEYLRMGVPAHTLKAKLVSSDIKRNRDYTLLQKLIRKNWPSDDIIVKMIHQRIDVSRKVMILLFLVTEEFEAGSMSHLSKKHVTAHHDKYLDDMIANFEHFQIEELMEMRIDQMNLYLDSYGMNRLDPCNAFDCIVLYALKASLDSERADHMDSRLQAVLKEIFNEQIT